MDNNNLNLKILPINDSQALVVFLFDDITEANKRYNDYKENVTIKIGESHDNRFAVEFKFVDIDVIRQFILNEAEMVALGLRLLNVNVSNRWTCGYEVNLDVKSIYPLKPLRVVVW